MRRLRSALVASSVLALGLTACGTSTPTETTTPTDPAPAQTSTTPAAPETEAPAPGDASAPGAPLPKALADELACVAQWIDRYGHRIRVISADGSLVPTGPPLPSFEPPVPFRR